MTRSRLFPLSLSTFLACGGDPLRPESTSTGTSAAPETTTLPTSTGVSEPTGTSADPAVFIMGPDTPGPECDTFAQTCPAGQKCVPFADLGGSAWNSVKCVDITGDVAPGEPCTAPEGPGAGIDDCAKPAICWNLDADNNGICVSQCSGDPVTLLCPAMHVCATNGDGILNLCLRTCHPLSSDCPDDELCIATVGEFLCVIDGSGDTGKVNDPCEFANACDKGLACLNTASASSACQQGFQGCCQPFCKLPNAPCPNPDQQCVPWYDPMQGDVPPGYEDLGSCAIPK